MKRILTLALTLLCALALLPSCQKAPELTITSPASIDLSADGSSGSITFTANRAWRVSSSDSWVTLSPSSGEPSETPVTVSVRCNANTTYEDRSATVTITMEELSQKVTVRQPANLGIVLPTQSYDLQSSAKTIEVTVQANVDYTVETSVDWIKQTGTKGLTSKTLNFSIEENKTYDAREGKITIKPTQAGVAEQVISVKQAQKDALIVEKTSYDMPFGGGEIEIKVEANVAFDVTPNVGWLHHVSTKALSSSTVLIKVDENATYSAREGKIEIAQQNGSLKHTITVKQAGRIAVTSVELDKANLTLRPEETATLVATVKPDNATDKTVTWTSSDTSIATVDETGKVTAVMEGVATITARAGEISANCEVIVQLVPKGAVDLGLVMTREDGTIYNLYWAECNLGASAPEKYGDYYAWGETEVKESYLWETYKFRTSGRGYSDVKFSKYNTREEHGPIDNKTILEPEDDAAHVKLGSNWRMPTRAEQDALRMQCIWTKTTRNGINGYEVKSKFNSNSIFLPAACGRYGTNRIGDDGSFGGYLSSSLDASGPTGAREIIFYYNDGVIGWDNAARYQGSSVRPVFDVTCSEGVSNNVVFGDAVFKAFCVEHYDLDGDGEISETEAARIKEVECDKLGVISLKGIECFPNLERLSCDGTYLERLDLRNCLSLKSVHCSSCMMSLTSINVSGCSSLQELFCASNLGLTALDIRGCTSLQILDCSGTILDSLDLSSCTSIKELHIGSYNLSDLKLRGNTSLQKLYCGALNSLGCLDVSGCSSLQHLECGFSNLTGLVVAGCSSLSYLNCLGNQLTNLDVTDCTSLEELNCQDNTLTTIHIGDNTSLKTLNCGSNKLSDIDVSGCTAMQQLYVSFNQLTSLDVSNNMQLQILLCFNNPNLSELWLRTGQTIETLAYNSEVTTIKYKD